MKVGGREFGLRLVEMKFAPTCEESKAPSCRSSRVWGCVVFGWMREVRALMLRRLPFCFGGRAGRHPDARVSMGRSFFPDSFESRSSIALCTS